MTGKREREEVDGESCESNDNFWTESSAADSEKRRSLESNGERIVAEKRRSLELNGERTAAEKRRSLESNEERTAAEKRYSLESNGERTAASSDGRPIAEDGNGASNGDEGDGEST